MICDESGMTAMGLAMVDVNRWIFSNHMHNFDREGLNRVPKRHVMYFYT